MENFEQPKEWFKKDMPDEEKQALKELATNHIEEESDKFQASFDKNQYAQTREDQELNIVSQAIEEEKKIEFGSKIANKAERIKFADELLKAPLENNNEDRDAYISSLLVFSDRLTSLNALFQEFLNKNTNYDSLLKNAEYHSYQQKFQEATNLYQQFRNITPDNFTQEEQDGVNKTFEKIVPTLKFLETKLSQQI